MPNSSVPELTDRPPLTGGLARAVIVGPFVVIWSVLWGTWSIAVGVLKLKGLARWGLTCWSRGILAVAGIRVQVTRRAPLKDARYVFFSNHQSALDIPILMAVCMQTHDVRFMAKESLFRIPIFGWGMKATGFVPIRREQARHSAELLKGMAQAQSAGGLSYLSFPEGTRSPDGRLQPLKKGAVGLALRMGLPIVPVTLIDAVRANPKKSLRIRAGTVQVVFHEPVCPETGADGHGVNRELRDDIAARIYETLLSALPDEQRPLPAAGSAPATNGVIAEP
ncbi:MAG: lysophospholipid acyltransferase family protein [Planctomycetota bacterium]|nr:lysophospholipid acyltransferase family protein [Planctomycetota bacterium]